MTEYTNNNNCDVLCKNIKKIVALQMRFKELINKYVEAYNNYINNRERNQTLTIKHKNESDHYYKILKNMINKLTNLTDNYNELINKNNRIIKEQNKLIKSKQIKLSSNDNLIDKKNNVLLSRSTSLKNDNNNNKTLNKNINIYIGINIVLMLFLIVLFRKKCSKK